MLRALLVSSPLFLWACALSTDPGWRKVVGLVDPGGAFHPALVAPDTVAAGAPFAVTVTTYGSSSCTRPSGAEVEVGGLTAEITPYDLQATRGACTDDLRAYARDVALRFTTPGEAVVRLRGRRFGSEPALFEARVVVRP